MDNYREKIVRIVERELKRTEEYQQRRDEYGNEEYILGCIMVKGDAFPKEVIAHAFVEDMGLELQFQVWRDEPRIRQKQAMWYDLTLFDVEGDFFGKLEQGYSILSVSDLFHCTAWNATEYLADEQNRDKENSCWKGMQRYLNYCKKHGITRNYLVKKEEYDGIDATIPLEAWCCGHREEVTMSIDHSSPYKSLAGKRTYTVEEIAKILGIGRTAAYSLVHSGVFKAVRIGSSIRVSKVSFDDWLDKQNM